MLPLWQSGDIWSSNAARAHAAGVGSSGVAAVLFLLTWCTGSKVLGALTCVAAAVDVACYLTWRTLGDESLELFCSGAESAAAALPDTAVATASNYLSCDFFAYTWIFWAILNLLALALVVAGTLYAQWDNITSWSYSTDVTSLSQIIGAAGSALAFLVFLLLWFIGGSVLAMIACLLAIVDAVCYGIWSWKGVTDTLCTGAASTASELGVSSDVSSSVLQCDASWMRWVLWALISISGSLQLSVAFSAVAFGGGGSGNSLGKQNHAAGTSTTAAHPAGTAVSRSLSKRSRRRQSDEEEALPLRKEDWASGTSDSETESEEEKKRRQRGYSSDEVDRLDGTYEDAWEKGNSRSRRRSVSLAGDGNSLSDDEMSGLEEGERRR
ncbi:hypothetical protein JCM8547_001101 [Rhodosporidiobolus lusitaniae]